MIKIEPQGQIYLCKTPLEADYKNQLTFANATAQYNYFVSTVVRSYDNNTYIRKDGGIKIACNAEEIRTCNYMFYRNTGFDNRIYYCFITSIEYLSENSTLVRFETDCFQTWYFDLVYKPCFVEREHVSDDTMGLHTVPEGLEVGEYEISTNAEIPLYTYSASVPNFFIAFMVTKWPYEGAGVTDFDKVGSVYTGLNIFAVSSTADAERVVEMYDHSSTTTSEAIKNIYIVPRGVVNTNSASVTQWNDGTRQADIYMVKPDYETLNSITVPEPETFGDSFQPKNNKLLCYPYKFFHITNNAGTDVMYRWEDMPKDINGQAIADITIEGVASCGGQSRLMLKRYKRYNSNLDNHYPMMAYGLAGAKLPTCSWVTDYYTNWLTQNAVSVFGNIAGSVTSGVVSGLTYGGTVGALVGGATSGLMSVIGAIGKNTHAETTPDQSKGDTSTGDITFAKQGSAFNLYCMTIREEYARIIDEFFSMYGYKVNRVKTPSITGRTYWNYVKTVDCNIEGNIPQEDLQIIRNMFNKGCTFWHGATNMYNYNLTNSIVS